MTEAERTALSEQLFVVIFGLRPDDGESGQAWVLATASVALSRAILGSVGPAGDAEPMLAFSAQKVRDLVSEAQIKFYRDRLTAGSGPRGLQ